MHNGASIRSYLSARKRGQTDPNCGVYMIPCEDTCGKVYIGHSQNIPKRLGEHAASVYRDSLRSYSVGKHVRNTGHSMKTNLQLVAYKSKSKTHRLIVESCLMQVSDTIDENTSSAFTTGIDLLAPMILKGAPLDWKIISIAQPSFYQRAIPKKYRRFFSNNTTAGEDEVAGTPTSGNSVVLNPLQTTNQVITRSQAIRRQPPDL